MASYSETRQGIGFPDWVIVRGSVHRLVGWFVGSSVGGCRFRASRRFRFGRVIVAGDRRGVLVGGRFRCGRPGDLRG